MFALAIRLVCVIEASYGRIEIRFVGARLFSKDRIEASYGRIEIRGHAG